MAIGRWICIRCLGRMVRSRWGNWFEHVNPRSTCECQWAEWCDWE